MAAILFGVAGASGSGKSTFVRALQALLNAIGLRVVILSMDHYYRDLSHLSEYDRHRQNFDHPRALDFPLLREHLRNLQQGQAIHRPIYSFVTHRVEGFEIIDPAGCDVIIVEGIMLFCDDEICKLIGEASAFVDVGQMSCFWRRLVRDRRERGRTVLSIVGQYLLTVLPGWWRHVRPYRSRARFRVRGGGLNVQAQEHALNHIQEHHQRLRQSA